jgi:uncharacterized protein (DUF2267 family)
VPEGGILIWRIKMDFNRYAVEGNIILKKISDDLNLTTDSFKAGRWLRYTLQTLRDCITTEESIQLLSQLPMMLKALYVDNWSTKKKPKIHTIPDFIELFKKHYTKENAMNIPYDSEIFDSVRIILNRLRNYISDGEIKDIKSVLSDELKTLFEPEHKSVYKSKEYFQF